MANLTCIWLEERKKERERENKKTDKKRGKEKKAEEKERGIGRIHVSKTKK